MARFWAFAGLSALLLISLQNVLVADLAARPLQEWTYVARLSAYAALLLSVPWTLLYGLERWLGRYAGLAGLLVVGAAFPIAREVARELAAGEGVAALRIPVSFVEWGATCVLCLGVLTVWAFQRANLRVRFHLPLGLLALAGLFAFDRVYLRNYGMLAPWLLISAQCIGASVLHHALSGLPRARNLVASLAGGSVLALLVLGLWRPGWVVSGRSTVLSDETSILGLDVIAFGAEIAAVQFDLELAEKRPCPTLHAPQAWPPLAIPGAKRRNVIMISVDALRRDMLGQRVAGRAVAPNLDAFARESWAHDEAYTTYPATLFALAGAVTGLVPSEILFAPSPPDTMFHMLQSRVKELLVVLPWSEWFAQPAIAKYVTQGAFRVSKHDGAAQTDEMLRRLKNLRAAGKPHVAWIHYLEPHDPYIAHPSFDFGLERAQKYYSEVAFVDAQIGRLLDGLRKGGWYDDSLIVFFADHGEALGERNYFGHHVFLNSWITNIPLMLHVPGGTPKRVSGAVSIVDVAPTVLHFLDQKPSAELSGRSLLGPPAARDRVIVSEAFPLRGKSLFDLANTPLTSIDELKARIELIQHGDRRYEPKVSLVRDHYRLIVRRTSGTAELYDTARDPHERHDLASERADLVASMMGEMAAFHRAQASRFYCAVKRLPPPRPQPPPRSTLPPPPPLPPLPKLPKLEPKASRSQH